MSISLNYSIKNERRDWIINITSLSLVLATLLLFLIDSANIYICILVCIINAIFVVKFYRCLPLLIIFIFLLKYNKESTKYFFDHLWLSANFNFQTPYLINKVLIINSLFIFFLGITIPSKVHRCTIDLKEHTFESKYLFAVLVFLGLLMIQFGITGASLLSGGNYGSQAADKGPMFEYFILVFYLILLVRPKNSAVAKWIVNILFFIFCTKSFLYGGRIEVVMIVLLFLYFNWFLVRKGSKMLFFIIAIIGIYVSSVLGMIRGNPVAFFKGDYLFYLNPINLLFTKTTQPWVNSQEGDVLHASARILGLVQEGILAYPERMYSFLGNLFAALLPRSILPDYVNLAGYLKSTYTSGGGGMITAYYYAWLGYAGPILAAIFIGLVIRWAYLKNNLYCKIYAVSILFTFPRWIAYGPVLLTKFCFYSFVIYLILKITFNTFLKSKHETSN